MQLKEKKPPANKITQEEALRRVKEHYKNDNFSYENFKYLDNKSLIIITCNNDNHGCFMIKYVSVFSREMKCPKCWELIPYIPISEFKNRANKIHNNKYNYDKVNFISSMDKITITCLKHGDFIGTTNSHLSGDGCYRCARELVGEKLRYTQDEFIKKANVIHNNVYDYDKLIFKGTKNNITFFCKIHNKEITIRADAHLEGAGCIDCKLAISSGSNGYKYTKEHFLFKVKEKFGNYDSIINIEPFSYNDDREFYCKSHDIKYFTTPKIFLNEYNNGCKKCLKHIFHTLKLF